MIPEDERIEKIKNLSDLALYIEELRQSLLTNQENWQNLSLEAYLEAMSAWLIAIDKRVELKMSDKQLSESLQLFANILIAGSVYE